MGTKKNELIAQASQGLTHMAENIGASLPQNIPTERFMRVAQMAIQDEYIAKAINDGADKSSLYSAVSLCAQDGLVLDKREAALVSFKGTIQYIPMVSGILKKVRNTGELESISCHVVYENDQFSYELGDNEHIYHVPTEDENPGKMVRVYAIAKLKGGGIQRCVMNERQINKHKKIAKTEYIWKAWPEEQWEKTCLKKLCKRLPQSTELDRVFEADNASIDLEKSDISDAEMVDTSTGEVETPPASNKKPAKRTTKAAQSVKNQTSQAPIDSTAKEINEEAGGFPLDQAGDPGFDEKEDVI